MELTGGDKKKKKVLKGLCLLFPFIVLFYPRFPHQNVVHGVVQSRNACCLANWIYPLITRVYSTGLPFYHQPVYSVMQVSKCEVVNFRALEGVGAGEDRCANNELGVITGGACPTDADTKSL